MFYQWLTRSTELWASNSLRLLVCCKSKVLERSREGLCILLKVWEEILQYKTLVQLYKMLVYMFIGSGASIHLWIFLSLGGIEGRGCGIWKTGKVSQWLCIDILYLFSWSSRLPWWLHFLPNFIACLLHRIDRLFTASNELFQKSCKFSYTFHFYLFM